MVKQYSLFQRSVRVIQTSIRRVDRWAAVRVPGLPNPPEIEARESKPSFVDLWELTMADHYRIFHEVWRDYKASFAGPTDEELEKSKEEVRRAVQAVRGQVSSTTGKNLAFIDKSLEGTRAHDNLHTLAGQGKENVKFLTKEIKHVADGVDTDAVISHAKQVVDDSRSKDDVATTLKKNVDELRHLAKEGRDAALNLDSKDVNTFKTSAQSWFADKLLVGQSVLMAFIDGYREGKELELEREDALLITFAKQAAEDHKDIIENHLKKIMDQQREKQRQEQEEAAAKAASEETGSTEKKQPAEMNTTETESKSSFSEQEGLADSSTEEKNDKLTAESKQR